MTRRAVTLVAHDVGTPGGMERQLAELATGLLSRGRQVTVVARQCRLPPNPDLEWVRIRGPERPFSLWYPWFFVFGSIALRRRARGLLHTTGAIVFNRADVSTVHFCHRAFEAQESVQRGSKKSLLYRLSAALASGMSRLAEGYCYRPARTRHLVAVSHGVARELGEFFPSMTGAVSVIPNGVDTGAFAPNQDARAEVRSELGIPESELVALFVGGDWDRKGLRYALEAVGRVPRWRLVVVGPGDTDHYCGIARDADAEAQVVFVGHTSDTAPYYAAADAFVMPTAYEAFPLVTLEAAAAGLPLLVSRVSGVEELIVEGENGWFISREADDIARRLRELASDRARARAMGVAARNGGARFDWAQAVEAYDRLYEQLAGDQATQGGKGPKPPEESIPA
jgi:UDP-glucose:(heptosyl)LPS alpha-1,3-glucosyltransferase